MKATVTPDGLSATPVNPHVRKFNELEWQHFNKVNPARPLTKPMEPNSEIEIGESVEQVWDGSCGWCSSVGIPLHKKEQMRTRIAYPVINAPQTSAQPLEEGEKEYIICSAIWFNDGKKHDDQPKNIETGLVVTGRRHHNCYATLTAIAASIGLDERIRLLMDKADRDKQGFITNTDRYVDRKEAYIIAKASNQIKFGAGLTDKENQILISENLY